MAFFKKEKIIKKYLLVGVHQVNGDQAAVEYLQYADPHFVESVFYVAKNKGISFFDWDGDSYEVRKNKDISYTIKRLTSREQKELESFK